VKAGGGPPAAAGGVKASGGPPAAAGGRLTAAARQLAMSWREITSVGAAPVVAFTLMMLGCVFVAVALPRQDLHMQTKALQQTFSTVPAVEKSVVASGDWNQLDSNPVSPYYTLSPADLDAQTAVLAQALSAVPVPLAPPSADWSGLTSAYGPVSGAGRSANGGAPPELEIAYRTSLRQHSQLVTGHEPDHSSVTLNPGVPLGTPGESAVRDGTFQVALTAATAARFGVNVGSRLTVQDGITLVVTGIIRPIGPGSAFWALDPVAAEPALGSAGAWTGAVFVGPDEVGDLQLAFGSPDMKVIWDFPLALASTNAADAAKLAGHLDTATDEDIAAGDVVGTTELIPGAIGVSSGLIPQLNAFLQAQAAVDSVLSLLLISLAVIGAVVVLLGTYMLAEHRAGEFDVLLARGASPRQLALRALRAAGLVVPAAAAGAVLAITVTPGANVPLAWWLGGGTVLVALAGPPLIAVRWHQAAERPAGRGAIKRRSARRLVTEATLVAAAACGLVVLRLQGLSPSGSVDLYTGASPVLVALPAAVLVMRLYPLALRGLLRASAAQRGVAGFLAMARAARISSASVLPIFALVLALCVAAFGAMVHDAVQRGQVAASWQATGADAVIDASGSPAGVSSSAQQAIDEVPGVQHTAAVTTLPGSLSSQVAVEVIVVHPASYAALVAATPWPRFPAAAVAPPAVAGPVPAVAGPVPAVASQFVAAGFGVGTVQLPRDDGGTLKLRVTATVSGTPALPGQDLFLVLPSWALSKVAPPNLLLVTGVHLDQHALATAVHRELPAATITFRSAALAALASSPLQHGADAIFSSGIAAAAGFSALIVLLSLALEARDRDLALARLAAMGLGHGQAARLAVLEALPVMLAAVAAGIVGGWALAPLTGSALDLSVFTGSGASVPVQFSVAAIAIPAAGLVVITLVVLLAQALVARHHGTAWALRTAGLPAVPRRGQGRTP
jgi:putative ABC transport system permease protein